MAAAAPEYISEVVPGLETFAQQEIAHLGGSVVSGRSGQAGLIAFRFDGDARTLLLAKVIQAVYLTLWFDVPRPKALLGHQHFQRLVEAVNMVIAANPSGEFASLGIDAAGSDSSVMHRLREELASATRLEPAQEERGDMLLRIMPDREKGGWRCLVRLSPRPIGTRRWRVRNHPAALNATVAHAMALLTQPKPDDVAINLCCGSGTLGIERSAAGSFEALFGLDIDSDTLQLAAENARAASSAHRFALLLADATRMPFASRQASSLIADLPFGQRSGSHRANAQLYPKILKEGARIAKPGALFVLLTHEIRLIEQCLFMQSEWDVQKTLPITLRGLHPRIYVLRRQS